MGNIVELWERCVERDIHVDLGSDQTSLHNPPTKEDISPQIGPTKVLKMLSGVLNNSNKRFKATLRRHANAINTMAENGMYFWDYGNAFLLETSHVGADVLKEDGSFKYPSYVEDIMGPLCFDYGFGPYRWVCTSGLPEDLAKTDAIAASVLRRMRKEAPEDVRQQINDNLRWMGSQVQPTCCGSQPDSLRRRCRSPGDRPRYEPSHCGWHPQGAGGVWAEITHDNTSGTDSPYQKPRTYGMDRCSLQTCRFRMPLGMRLEVPHG